MTRYLLDTNHLGEAIRRISPLREHIRQVHRQGMRVGTCMPVLCELEPGIQSSRRPQGLYLTLDRLLEELRIWPIDRIVAKLFGQIYLDLQQRGRALSHVDIVLAALARRMKLTVLTADRDFAALPEIRTENWIG